MLTDRIEKIRQNYINAKPAISCERAQLWTESHKKTEGQHVAIRRAQAFYDTCENLTVHIFDGGADRWGDWRVPQMWNPDAGVFLAVGRQGDG